MTGFIRRYVLHAEWHPGYRPRLSIRRAAQHGDRVEDGGQLGTLHRCRACGDGFLFEADDKPTPSSPSEEKSA